MWENNYKKSVCCKTYTDFTASTGQWENTIHNTQFHSLLKFFKNTFILKQRGVMYFVAADSLTVFLSFVCVWNPNFTKYILGLPASAFPRQWL